MIIIKQKLRGDTSNVIQHCKARMHKCRFGLEEQLKRKQVANSRHPEQSHEVYAGSQ